MYLGDKCLVPMPVMFDQSFSIHLCGLKQGGVDHRVLCPGRGRGTVTLKVLPEVAPLMPHGEQLIYPSHRIKHVPNSVFEPQRIELTGAVADVDMVIDDFLLV
jgi:hypothetical protein